MTKIGLLTRSHISNYGSFLQTFATVTILRQLGYQVTVISYVPNDETPLRSSSLYFSNRQASFLGKVAYFLLKTPDILSAYYGFERQRRNSMKLTKTMHSITDLKKIGNSYDIYVTGSDQVWGPIGRNSDFDESYFLSFTNKRKISLASSFGDYDFFFANKGKMCELLRKYEFVFIREQSMLSELTSLGIHNLYFLTDPVFLLTKESWILKAAPTKHKHKYVLLYDVHSDRQLGEFAKKYATQTNLELVNVSPVYIKYDNYGKNIRTTNSWKFLSYITNAEFVITNSFMLVHFAHCSKNNLLFAVRKSRMYALSTCLKGLDSNHVMSVYKKTI
jgi:hypothetical protein